MDWVEKVSVYVFSTRKDFVEFVRTVETREIDADTVSSASYRAQNLMWRSSTRWEAGERRGAGKETEGTFQAGR